MEEMSMYQRVVKGIECCQFGLDINLNCDKCPYFRCGCGEKLKEDTLRLLWNLIPDSEWYKNISNYKFLTSKFNIGEMENE